MRKIVPIAALTLALGAGLLAPSSADASSRRGRAGFRHGHSSVSVVFGARPRLRSSFSLSFGAPLAYCYGCAPRVGGYVYDGYSYPYDGYSAYDSYYPYDPYYSGYSTYYDRGYYGGSVYFGRDGHRSHRYDRHDGRRDHHRSYGNRYDGRRDGNRYDGRRDGNRYDGRRDGDSRGGDGWRQGGRSGHRRDGGYR